MKLTGKVHKFGADVNTDVIIPARYLSSDDPAVWAEHCMEDIDPEFASRVQPGDFIVATRNFGCGSSREQAPICIKAAGVSVVIAESFARIFYRNAINIGLSILECPEADLIDAGVTLSADLATGEIVDNTNNRILHATPYPDFMRGIVEAGGLLEYTIGQLQAKKRQR